MNKELYVDQQLHVDDQWHQIPGAVSKAFWTQLTGSVNEGNSNLLPMSVYMLCKRLTHMQDKGVNDVSVSQIRGRVGLSPDFDRSFVPRQSQLLHEWTRMDHGDFPHLGLPMIDLLKIEEMYFVLSEHQPLPVMSGDESEYIQARVIEAEEINAY